MTVIPFQKPGGGVDFKTIAAHIRAAAEMVRSMDRDQLNDFWAQAHLYEMDADDDDLAASMLFHLAEWESEVRDEWIANKFLGGSIVD